MGKALNTRDVRVTFKINEDVKERVVKYADEYGMSVSAMCAMIIGQWTSQQDRLMGPVIAELQKEIAKAVGGSISQMMVPEDSKEC